MARKIRKWTWKDQKSTPSNANNWIEKFYKLENGSSQTQPKYPKHKLNLLTQLSNHNQQLNSQTPLTGSTLKLISKTQLTSYNQKLNTNHKLNLPIQQSKTQLTNYHQKLNSQTRYNQVLNQTPKLQTQLATSTFKLNPNHKLNLRIQLINSTIINSLQWKTQLLKYNQKLSNYNLRSL